METDAVPSHFEHTGSPTETILTACIQLNPAETLH